MAIKNSVRDVLPGFGTSGLRGGKISGASPATITVPMGMSMGRWRVQSTTALTTISITGTDGANPPVTLVGMTIPAGAGACSLTGSFLGDQMFQTFICTATGTIDFEIWGQPGAQ